MFTHRPVGYVMGFRAWVAFVWTVLAGKPCVYTWMARMPVRPLWFAAQWLRRAKFDDPWFQV